MLNQHCISRFAK